MCGDMRDDAWHDDYFHGSEDFPAPVKGAGKDFRQWEQQWEHEIKDEPYWTWVDTFLRRLAMVGAAVLVWALATVVVVAAWLGEWP